MSEHHRDAWGAHGPGPGLPGRNDAVWWSDQQQQGLANLQHQLAQQHQQQLAQQLQQQQQHQHELAQLQQQQNAQQLFSYKMASSFQNAAAAVSSSSYDLNTVNTINTSIAGQLQQQQQQQLQQVQQQVQQAQAQQQQNNQWWYPGGMQNPTPNNTQNVNTNMNVNQQMVGWGPSVGGCNLFIFRVVRLCLNVEGVCVVFILFVILTRSVPACAARSAWRGGAAMLQPVGSTPAGPPQCRGRGPSHPDGAGFSRWSTSCTSFTRPPPRPD